MKKKITVALILVILLSFAVGALTGCDEIFKKNAERDARQIVATVSYDGQVAYVQKSELASSFNSYAYTYVNYYGMTYQAAADYLLRSLAQRELLVLFAKEQVAKAFNIDTEPSLLSLRDLLTSSEYDKAVKDTNEDMVSALNSIIETLIEDDKYNSGENVPEEKDEEVEVTDPVKIYFKSNGGTEVAKQKIQRNTKADEPAAPTREGFTFFGWYSDEALTVKFDFDQKITADSTTLYAKWAPYTAPRPVREVPEEEEDYDPDFDDPDAEITPTFFSDEFRALIDAKEIELADDEYYAEKYLNEGIDQLKKNLTAAFHDYDYYLQNEMKTLLIAKLERLIGNKVTVSEQEIQIQFDRLVAQNKETFKGSSTAYKDALGSALASTYFHKYTTESYGFVINILLKLDDEALEELTSMIADGTVPAALVQERRDQLLKEIEVKISNPDYDAEAEVHHDKDADGNEKEPHGDGKCPDPMTCPDHSEHNDPAVENEFNRDNDYNKILEFVRDDVTGKWSIVCNISECPTMAYALKTMPAFSDDAGVIGIVDQIYGSFKSITDEVSAGRLTHIESVYWLREMATQWLYLVGDDTGGTTTESNNNGLGYLVSPVEDENNYVESFTKQAQDLFALGTGSFTTNGNVSGSYVFGDNFIESRDTSSAYAGVFILLASHVVWDRTNCYTVVETESEDGTVTYSERKLDMNAITDGILPMEYIMTYGKTLEDCVTVRRQIEDNLLTGKKADRYNLEVNNFGIKYAPNITYNHKAYKSLWKNLD